MVLLDFLKTLRKRIRDLVSVPWEPSGRCAWVGARQYTVFAVDLIENTKPFHVFH